jgi:3-oxoacyl-(acyl-carrier-protein) synthase/acyl carrier protein
MVPMRLGQDLGRESLLTGHEYVGRELGARGIAQRVLPREQVLAEAHALARRMARTSRGVLKALKRQWTASLLSRVEETYAQELSMHDETFVGRAETRALIEGKFERKPVRAPGHAAAPLIAATTSQEPAPRVETLHSIKARLKASLDAELHMQGRPIDDDDQFVHLGLDSISGVTWIRRINEDFGTSYEATMIYSYPTIRELAAFLQSELKLQPELELKLAPTVSFVPIEQKTVAPSIRTDFVPVETLQSIKARLKTSLDAELHMQGRSIDDDDQFVHLGLDSISGVTWMRRINQDFGTSYEATMIYSYPTIRELAAFLQSELKTAHAPVAAPIELLAIAPSSAASTVPYRAHDKTHAPRLAPRKAMAAVAPAHDDDRIAIIGMSGRYPQARNLDEYWKNLETGKDCIVEVPATRWDIDRYYDADPRTKDKMASRWLGAMSDVDCFDPLFFRISPDEAEYMDPQHRLFLQESYRAFEDAGYSSRALNNRLCGVYLGISTNEYSLLLSQNGVLAAPITGNSYSIAAARIAYYLNLKGPAISVDTACSSSLVSLHLACQALRSREVDMALAGGVSLWLVPESYLAMSQAGMLSPIGRCRAFDDAADGIVMGDGVGALVLKRLKDAEADNDFIHGVIIGSGTNQDGRTNGITAPSVISQIELERGVYAKYGIDPATISYVETHGTGTKLGDPIELEALATVFKEKTDKKGYCALSSVKSNIGHAASAAGVASVQKVILSLRHRMLAPTLHVTKENSHFDFKGSPFYVNRTAKPWDTSGGAPRRACVNSFGYSGTNAHVVIEEYMSPAKARMSRTAGSSKACVLPLSARTTERLQEKAGDFLAFLGQPQPPDISDIAYTLQLGRDAMEERVCFVSTSLEQLASQLRSWLAGEVGVAGVNCGDAGSADSGEDMSETLDRWVDSGALPELAKAWACGADVDWQRLHGAAKPLRISLPTYPFAKEHYWIQKQSSSGLADGAFDEVGSLQWIEDILAQVDSDRIEEQQAVALLEQWV